MNGEECLECFFEANLMVVREDIQPACQKFCTWIFLEEPAQSPAIFRANGNIQPKRQGDIITNCQVVDKCYAITEHLPEHAPGATCATVVPPRAGEGW
jgi:hypothetical protein